MDKELEIMNVDGVDYAILKEVKNLTVDITANKYIFKMGSSKVVFDGFSKKY